MEDGVVVVIVKRRGEVPMWSRESYFIAWIEFAGARNANGPVPVAEKMEQPTVG